MIPQRLILPGRFRRLAQAVGASSRRISSGDGVQPISVAWGDGIGPEVMGATLSVMKAAGARVSVEEVQCGEQVYLAGHRYGIAPESWDKILATGVFLKGPTTMPEGRDYRLLSLLLRKALGMYANVRPCTSYHPFVRTLHPGMDVVVIRENEEDLYAGAEHRQTQEVYQTLRLTSVPGTERIVRYAFDYARRHHRRKVSCFVKESVMSLSDGLFRSIFDEVSQEFPELEADFQNVDEGAAALADTPENFDVVVLPNLYGDILSGVAAQIAGSVGLVGSANVGTQVSMFEPVHGSAPRRAGLDMANPSGMLLSSVLLLEHIGQADVAERIHNAWLRTIEDGVHTYDVYREPGSSQKVGTADFGKAVIARLGLEPQVLGVQRYLKDPEMRASSLQCKLRRVETKVCQGVDVFFDRRGVSPKEFGDTLMADTKHSGLMLDHVANRGMNVWPVGLSYTFCVDHWRARFVASPLDAEVSPDQIIDLLRLLHWKGYDVIKTENLYMFDGKSQYSMGND